MKKRKVIMAGLIVLLIAGGAIFAYFSLPQPEYSPYQYGATNREHLPRMTLLNHQQIMHEVVGHSPLPVKTIGILVYDGVSTLEAIEPMVVFSELMDVKVEYIGRHKGVIASDLAQIVVERSIEDVAQLDVLILPGGSRDGLQTALSDITLLDWVKRVDKATILTAGVGYGTLFLADTGLLRDRQITFSWPQAEQNAIAIGARFYEGHYTHDGKYWTSVGGASAIDMTLAMIQSIAGSQLLQAAMLDLEYSPASPFSGGTIATTPPEILDLLAASTYEHGALVLFDSSSPPVKVSNTTSKTMQVGILVYDGFFTLDAMGPLAVLSQLGNTQVRLIRAGDKEEIKSGRTRLIVPTSISDVSSLDVLLVPGGSNGTWDIVQNTAVLDWIRAIDHESHYTTSVCTGSWVLGAAGLLKDRQATTNWYRANQMMTRFGAQFKAVRYISDDKYWTSAGVSAGIDMSFALIAEIQGKPAAQAAMMRLHYHPEPPINAGTPETTDDLVLDMMHQMYDYIMVPLIRD